VDAEGRAPIAAARTKVLNNELEDVFRRWYPQFRTEEKARSLTPDLEADSFLFSIWFLAIASAVNGVAHPVLSLVSGGYFPGLWSSPLVGVAGVFLLRALPRLSE